MRYSCLIAIAAFVFSPGAWAQATVSTDVIYACAEIEADTERLACFDITVSELKSAEDAGEVAMISKTEMSKLNRESFGFSMPSLPDSILPKFGSGDDNGLDVINESVKSVKRLHYDNIRVTLENGQVWEQTDSKRVNFSQKRGVESAEIKRAALGSFKMKLDGGRSFRARRVK